MRYDSNIIEQVASLNDIVEVISGYVSIKKTGRSFKGLCPFHSEKTPSFHVNPDRQIFHCFGCQTGGDVIEFVQKTENLTFPEALEFLAKRVNFQLPRKNFESKGAAQEAKNLAALYERALHYYRELYRSKAGEKARSYMAKRGFGEKALEDFEVGYSMDEWRGLTDFLSREDFTEPMMLKSGLVNRSPSGSLYDLLRARVIFPIRNPQGRVIGFGGRVIAPEGKPKYLNSPETEAFKKGKELFALQIAKKNLVSEKPNLLIVEGYLDCLRLHEAGFKNAVATLGTALTEDHVRLIRRYVEEAILIFDGDKAGASASFRSLDIFLEEGFPVKVVSLEGGLDPDDYVREKGAEAFRKKIEGAQDFFEFKLDYLLKRYPQKDSLGLLKVTSNLLEVIARVPSRILQDHYLKKLGQTMGVDENSLRMELGKLREKIIKSPLSQPASKQAAETDTGCPSKEEMMLLYLLAEGEEARSPDISEQYFTTEASRKAYETLKEMRLAGGSVSFSAFLKKVESPILKQKLAELAFIEWSDEERAKALEDCRHRLTRQNNEEERRLLEGKIRKAEADGDAEKLQLYLKNFQQLTAKGNR